MQVVTCDHVWPVCLLQASPGSTPTSLPSQVSFGSILTPIGVFLLTYGFGSFFQLLPGADVAAILLIYGFPITLLGFALSYAQLRPVPCKSTREALALRDSQATDIQKQARPGCCGTTEPASGGSIAREGETTSV